jgi:hypothetical protein
MGAQDFKQRKTTNVLALVFEGDAVGTWAVRREMSEHY